MYFSFVIRLLNATSKHCWIQKTVEEKYFYSTTTMPVSLYLGKGLQCQITVTKRLEFTVIIWYTIKRSEGQAQLMWYISSCLQVNFENYDAIIGFMQVNRNHWKFLVCKTMIKSQFRTYGHGKLNKLYVFNSISTGHCRKPLLWIPKGIMKKKIPNLLSKDSGIVLFSFYLFSNSTIWSAILNIVGYSLVTYWPIVNAIICNFHICLDNTSRCGR